MIVGIPTAVLVAGVSGSVAPVDPSTVTGVTMDLNADDATSGGSFTWASRVGAMSFTNPAAGPTLATVSTEQVVRFTAASSQYLQGNANLSTVMGVATWHAFCRLQVRSYVGTNVHPTATWNNESLLYTFGTRWGLANNGGASDIGVWLWDGASQGDHLPVSTSEWVNLYCKSEVIDPPTSPTNRITIERFDPGKEAVTTFDADDILSLASVPWIGRGSASYSNMDGRLITLANASFDVSKIPGIKQHYLNGGV